MKNRVITRERGVIPGCRPAGGPTVTWPWMDWDGRGWKWRNCRLPSTRDLPLFIKRTGNRGLGGDVIQIQGS
jgi:hypothetical protein